jgi:site-specific recombinase XerD
VLLERRRVSEPEAPLFISRRGGKLTRFGVRYLLHKYLQAVSPEQPTLQGKRIHPHSLCHTTAIHLLKAGVDLATISHWLGHASVNTTMRYARADLDLKRQALLQVFPDVLAPASPRTDPCITEVTLVDWLKRL